MLGDLPLLVAGSTHEGEEAAALAALAEVESAGWPAALVLAPRHIERSREVAGLVRSAGRRVRFRSKPGAGPLRAGEVLLVDTLGELASLYGHADVAFVGGSLAPVGGHNLLEPVLSQRPVLFGPHTDSVKHVASLLEACGAGRRLLEAGEFGEAALELLREPELARSRGEAGFRALASHRGSADRAAALVLSALRDAQA
jgi:3-deoxy-D-manno-octulosonic-acid transferase